MIEFLDIEVDECGAHLTRDVVHKWRDEVECEGGLALPEDTRVDCSESTVSPRNAEMLASHSHASCVPRNDSRFSLSRSPSVMLRDLYDLDSLGAPVFTSTLDGGAVDTIGAFPSHLRMSAVVIIRMRSTPASLP